MGKPTAILMALFCFVFGLLMLSNTIPIGIDSCKSEAATQNFSVATDPAVTAADCTLTYASYYTDVSYFDVTSTESTDIPIVMSYTEGTKVLNIDGLDDDNSRILTVSYSKDRDNDQFTGLNLFLDLMPFIIGCILIYMVIKEIF